MFLSFDLDKKQNDDDRTFLWPSPSTFVFKLTSLILTRIQIWHIVTMTHCEQFIKTVSTTYLTVVCWCIIVRKDSRLSANWKSFSLRYWTSRVGDQYIILTTQHKSCKIAQAFMFNIWKKFKVSYHRMTQLDSEKIYDQIHILRNIHAELVLTLRHRKYRKNWETSLKHTYQHLVYSGYFQLLH